jgi:hypothetical protein
MSTKYLIRATIALAALGVACGQKPAAQSGSRAPASTAAAPASGGTRVEYITDPTLNDMKAIAVKVPAKWHFQGVLYQGGKCASMPFGVFRATSPDGLSFVERMPEMGWTWAEGPYSQFLTKDCLPLTGPMKAQDLLKFMAATMKVQYVADDPVPAEQRAAAQKVWDDSDASMVSRYAQMHVQPPKNTAELAQAFVSFQNGTFAMKGTLAVRVHCVETHQAGMSGLSKWSPGHPVTVTTGPPSTIHTCTAAVRYAVAPQNQFEAVMKPWLAPGMGANGGEQEWSNAWTQRMLNQAQQMTAEMNRVAAVQRQAQQQQFEHDQAVRQQMHEQFLSTLQRGTDMSMARTQANMNARSTATSDWVDYALDRQTVRDPTTGQVSKVSSAYSYTWVDSTGKNSYQTMSPNADPNGTLGGTWTRQQVVHGDGTNK